MKRFLGILLATVILFSSFATVAFAAGTSLSGNTVTGEAGKTAKVSFTVSEVTYGDYGYVVSVDKGLTLSKINSGAASKGDEDAEESVLFISNVNNGKVGASANKNITRSGVLFTVTVKVDEDIKPGKYEVKLKKDSGLTKANGKAVGEAISSGWVVIEGPECDHKWDEGKVTTKPTCVKTGVKTYTCSICGDTKTESIPKVAHNYSNTWSKDAKNHWHECTVCGDKIDVSVHSWKLIKDTATCGNGGKATYECSVCGQTKTENSDANGNHKWDAGKITTNPTCSKVGVKTYNCTVCGETKTESVPKVAHNYSNTWSKDAKNHWHECTVCGDVADKAAHSWKLIKDTATCGNGGKATYECSVCGQTKTENSDATGNHNWDAGKVTTKPTCVKTGVKTYTCTVCGGTRTEVLLTVAHSYGNTWSKDAKNHWHECTVCGEEVDKAAHTWKLTKDTATCDKAGKATYECSVCGQTKTEDSAATGKHTWDAGKVTTKPTCVKAGVKTFTCTVCGNTKTEPVAATGHSYTSKVTAPTCTAEGYTTYTCSNCGDSYVDNKVPALGHDYVVKSEVKATCVDAGSITYKCSRCGDEKTETVPATGKHTWDAGKVTTKPTCTAEGVKTFTCTVCGETKTEPVSALGHNYNKQWSKNDTHHWYECSVCGDVTDKAEHEWVVISDTATCGKPGVKTSKCSVCGATKEEVSNPNGGHAYKLVSDTATCGKDGIKTWACDCGDTYTEKSPATGKHTYGSEWVSDGAYHWHECSVCGYQGDKAEHKFDKLISDSATCGKGGIKVYQCVCGAMHEEISEATGKHNWKLISDTATCGKAGIKTYECSVCGAEKTEKSEPNGEHDLETKWSYDKKEHWHECSVCGYKADCGKHEFGWHIVKKATAKENGLKQYICETCGYVKKEVILDKIEGLDDVPQTGDVTGQLAFGAFAAVMALAAAAWLVLKRKIAK